MVRTREELLSLPDTVMKVLGLFALYHTFNDQPEERLLEKGLVAWPEEAPTIAEMTQVALDVLSRSGRRFFLVSEEEGSDNMSNANNAMGEIMAGQRADEAIGAIQAFIADNPNTLMVMTSDSDAGGMQVFGQPFPADTAPARATNGAPMDGVEGTNGRLFLAAPDANGVRHPFTIMWAQYHDVSGGILMKADGLGAEQVHGTMDNTDVYRVMYSVLFGPLPAPRTDRDRAGRRSPRSPVGGALPRRLHAAGDRANAGSEAQRDADRADRASRTDPRGARGVAVVAIVRPVPMLILAAVAIEFWTHLGVDWFRGKMSVRRPALGDPNQRVFWTALGLDQLAHALVLVGIAFLALL